AVALARGGREPAVAAIGSASPAAPAAAVRRKSRRVGGCSCEDMGNPVVCGRRVQPHGNPSGAGCNGPLPAVVVQFGDIWEGEAPAEPVSQQRRLGGSLALPNWTT